jgi:YesN/AraC family two-component response regulator
MCIRPKNGQGALAVINSTAIDLLVTDLRMPLMDGITLVRQIVAPACRSWLLEQIATANPRSFIPSLL